MTFNFKKLKARASAIHIWLTEAFLNVFAWLRLLDENRQLSLTNIAVIIILWKIAASPTIDAQTIAALLTATSAYGFKRYIQRKQSEKNIVKNNRDSLQAIVDKVNEHNRDLNAIKLAVGMKRGQKGDQQS